MVDNALAAVCRTTPVAFCLVGPDNRVITANSEWLHSKGLVIEYAIGRDILEVSSLERGRLLDIFARVRAGETVTVPRHRHIGGQHESWWEGTVSPMAMGGGQIGLLVSDREVTFGRDVTPEKRSADALMRLNEELERRVAERTAQLQEANTILAQEISDRCEAEGALRESEARFRRLAENAPDIIFRYEFGPPVHYSYVSPAVTTILGYTPDEFYADPNIHRRLLHPEGLPRTAQNAKVGDLQETVTRWIHIDGHPVWTSVRYAHVYDDNGDPVAVEGIARDVTKRELREAALRESEARFRRLAENAEDIIFRYEYLPVRRSAYVSPASTAITGYTPEDHYGDPDHALKIVDPEYRHLIEGVGVGRIPSRPMAIKWRHKDGHPVWTEERWVPVYDDQDNLVAVEGVARDITERKRLEEQLLRAQRLETAGRIAGQVAHDFNNLLSPLMLLPRLIQMELPEDHPASRRCDVMLESAEQMAEIAMDMLTLSRRGLLKQEPISMNRLARRTIELLSALPATLVVTLDLADDLLTVGGSGAQLSRVLSNLISNAREAMNDVGILRIETKNVYIDEPSSRYNRVEIGEYVRLSVSDTGCGIPLEIRDTIFDAFFTTKSTNKRRGSGLGLSVVQAIVEDHRGCIDLQSEIGKGTTFTIYLPVLREPVHPKQVERLPGGTESILVVDDDRLQQGLLGSLLSRLGYDVHTASSGIEAVTHLLENSVDLLILDMVMPSGMDGAETYQRVLQTRPGQKAIIASGYSQTDRVVEALALGAGAFLPKPMTLESLARAVRDELDREK